MKVSDANLKTKIISHIKNNGPINLSSFMEMCLHDKQFGYYSNSNVIGKNGDFITAPEVSQVFGELIAANIIDNQIKSNFFKANIVDLGPGKGTLISDIFSTIKKLKKSNYYLNKLVLLPNGSCFVRLLSRYQCQHQQVFHQKRLNQFYNPTP